MKVKIEYEIRPIRHISIQCPNCGNWFYGSDVTDDNLNDIIDVEYAVYQCPVCYKSWNCNQWDDAEKIEIQECDNAEEVYEGCSKKKIIWE